MFWKRDKKPLLREIAEGLNISAAREKGIEIDEDFAPFDDDTEPQGIPKKKTDNLGQRTAQESGSRKKILVDDFVVQRYGDQKEFYVEEPPKYPELGQTGQNRHPYLKTTMQGPTEKVDDYDSYSSYGHGSDGGGADPGQLNMLDEAIDDIQRITQRQEDLFSKWGQLTDRLDNLSKISEDLDRLNPFLTKFYDLERKLAGLSKLEERILALETGMDRMVPALENIDDDIRALAVKVTENPITQNVAPGGLPDMDRLDELGGMIDDRLNALARLEEKLAALPDQMPEVALPDDRFDHLARKIDEKFQTLSSIDQRLAQLEERMAARPEVDTAQGTGIDLTGLERKLDGLADMNKRLAVMEENITALSRTPVPPPDGNSPDMTRVEAALGSLENALNELPRISGQLEKMEAVTRNYQTIEDKLQASSEVIDRELSELRASSEPEGENDQRVTMVFDDDQWKEEY